MFQITKFWRTTQSFLPRNKYLRFSILAFALWFVISTFFYFQHYRAEKVIPLNEEVMVGNLTVKIKELSLVNYELKSSDFPELPWYYEFINKLPQPLRLPFIRLCHFYSLSPFDFNSKTGTIYLHGYIISPDNKLTYKNIDEQLSIYVAGPYEVGYLGGEGMSASSDENVIFFEEEGKNVPLDVQELYIIVTDKLNNSTNKISINPKWETRTYTFFNWKPYYPSEPDNTIKNFTKYFIQGEKPKAEEYIQPDRAENFPWINLQHNHWEKPRKSYLNYSGSYSGYENVFSYRTVFGKVKDNKFIGLAEQYIYLIDTGKKWTIIDVSPIKEI